MLAPGAGCGEDARSILVVLSAEQFCVSKSKGDQKVNPDASGRCTISWNKYPDLADAWLGGY